MKDLGKDCCVAKIVTNPERCLSFFFSFFLAISLRNLVNVSSWNVKIHHWKCQLFWPTKRTEILIV